MIEQVKTTIEIFFTKLKDLELTYSPMLNHAALVTLNQLYGRYKEVKVSQVRELVETNTIIIDAREKG
ncbi:hypothetical protein [Oceanobacillus sp. CF4.6]|uniref:hypothetical protein n=1 Tax=Oceanobacillus sp. CF4.6 TaxID=3373080 RepID=UPI003EE6D0D6